MKIRLPIELRYQSEASPSFGDGVWFASSDRQRWIDWRLRFEMARPNDTRTLDWYRLPGEAGLIVLSRGNSSIEKVLSRDDGIPLRRLALPAASRVCLWIASCGRLEPATPPSWLDDELPAGDDVVSVWLPTVGLVVFEADDRLRWSDLLSPPVACLPGDSWTSPPEVDPAPTHLAGLTLRDPLTLDDVMGQNGLGSAGSGIGDDADHLGNQSDSQKTASGKVKSWLLKKMDGLAGEADSNKPADPNRSSAANRSGSQLGSFGKGIQGFLSRNLKEERDSQLSKLLQMAQRDPDKALRFAIPLTGTAAFRGLAIPGAKLLSRLPQFSMGSIGGGGGPADFWNVDPAIRAKLVAAYHEMANREMAAGRHRRAAYIHANLLGNLSAAASALEQGGFFQEAAVLYRDKLNRPDDTARCWMSAGMFEQAAELYSKRNNHEQAAEAWRRAGRDDLARHALERAVSSLTDRRLILEASTLIADRLDDRDRALALLWRQWPDGSQVQPCLQRAFAWVAAAGQHVIAMEILQHVLGTTVPTHRLALVELTHHLANHYPTDDIRTLASDQCRVAVSRLIRETDGEDNHPKILHAMSHLKSLDKTNVLLASDAVRFQETRRKLAVSKSGRKAHTRSSTVARRHVERLPRTPLFEGTCHAACMVEQELFSLYEWEEALWIQRVPSPHGMFEKSEAMRNQLVAGLNQFPGSSSDLRILSRKSRVWLQLSNQVTCFEATSLKAPDDSNDWIVDGKWPGDLQAMDAAVATSENRFAGVVTVEGETLVMLCNEKGQTMRTHSLIHFQRLLWDESGLEPVLPPAPSTTHIASMDQQLVVAIGDTFIVRPNTNQAIVQPVGHAIHRLCVSPRNTRKRIAVAHEGGLDVYWLEMGELHRQRLETEMPFQHVVWMDAGGLFAISDRTLHRYQLQGRSLMSSGRIGLHGKDAIALLALSGTVGGVLDHSGLLERFE